MILKKEGSNKKWVRMLAIVMTLAFMLMGTAATYAASENIPVAGETSKSAPAFGAGETSKSVTTALASVAGETSKSAAAFPKDGEIGTMASWGEIVLTWSGRDYAYSTMKTYAGTAYYLYAQVSGVDSLGSIPAQSNEDWYVSSVTTAKIFSRSTSSPVTWYAYGEIQDTSSSGTQTASVSQTV